MKRYGSLAPTVLFSCLIFLSCKHVKKENVEKIRKPNVLFITTDYTRGADLELLGGILKMPTVKKLYEEGVVFKKHSCVGPICMPARASIVTGLYPHSHSLWDNQPISIKRPEWPFLMRDLKKIDYTTVGIGKMHFNPFNADYDFDIRVSLEGKDVDYRNDDYEKYLEEHGTSRKEIREKHIDKGRPSGQDFYPWHVDEKLHPDYFVGEKTVEAIKNGSMTKEKPWFMWMSFTGPHNPWNPPRRYIEIYKDLEHIPDGDFVEGELKNKPIEYSRHRYGYGGDLLHRYDSLPKGKKVTFRKELKAAHYGSLSFVDEQIARAIAELERQDLLKNTIIIFTSDHGSALFDNEMLHKGSPFPTQSIVPLIVWAPDYFEPGARNGFTSHVDMYPTLIQLAGGEPHPKVEGQSFVGALKSSSKKIRDFVVIESALVTALMNDDWLIGFHPLAKEMELYDLTEDPMCHDNIIDEMKNKEVVANLRKALVDWRRAKNPELDIPEDPLYWNLNVLGDTIKLSKLKNGYLKAYGKLTHIDTARPGIVGNRAVQVLKKMRSLE